MGSSKGSSSAKGDGCTKSQKKKNCVTVLKNKINKCMEPERNKYDELIKVNNKVKPSNIKCGDAKKKKNSKNFTHSINTLKKPKKITNKYKIEYFDLK